MPSPMPELNDLLGKTAVITGAASGIGLALARRAAAEGMNLVLADIDGATLAQAAASLNLDAARVLCQTCDVRHAAALTTLAEAAYGRFGAVHLLCNNAGVALGRVTWEHTTQDWEWVLGVNLWGVIHGVNAFLPRMMAAGEAGGIVNVASAAGLVSTPGMAAYNVSKHGVVTLSETLHHDLRLAQSPLRVALLCPAWVSTGIGHSERNRPADCGLAQKPGAISSALMQRIGEAIASGRLTADDMAAATFDAVKQDRFYVIPHRALNAAIELRLSDILELRNPTPL